MGWQYCGCIVAFVISLSLGLHLTHSSANADDSDLRTWTSAGGKSTVEAELLAVRAGKVYLKRKDGVLFSVRPEQLSKADRHYLDSLQAGSSTIPAASPDAPALSPEKLGETIAQCRDACVVLRSKVNDTSGATAGVLIHRDANFSYVLGNSRLFYRPRLDRDDPAPKYELHYQVGDDEFSSIAAEAVGRDGALAVWRVATKNLPKPLAPVPATVAAGEKVVVVGRAMAEEPDGVGALIQKTALVRSGVRATGGDSLPTFHIQGDGIDAVALGAVISDSGKLLGIATRGRGEPTGVTTVYPAESLLLMLAPRLGSVKFNPENWNAEGVNYSVDVRAVDPFGRIAKATLLVATVDPSEGDLSTTQPSDEGETPPLTGDNVHQIPLAGSAEELRAQWRRAGVEGPWEFRTQLQLRLNDGKVLHSRIVSVQPRFVSKNLEMARLTQHYYNAVVPHAGGGVAWRWRTQKLKSATETPLPKPVDEDEPLAKRPIELDGGLLHTLRDVKGFNDQRSRFFTQWSSDGAFVYFLSTEGELRKVSVPAMKCIKRLQLPKTCTYLTAGDGFLIVKTGLPNAGRMWVIDETSLEVQSVVPVEGHTFAVQPGTSNVYTVGEDILRIDLSDLKNIQASTFTDEHVRRGGRAPLHSLKFTADGKYLFANFGARLVRFRVEALGLVPEEFTQEIGASAMDMVMLDEGRRFACTTRTARLKAADHPAFDQGIYWYNTNDLSKPTAAMERSDRKWSIHPSYAENSELLSMEGKYRGKITNITKISNDRTESPIIRDLPQEPSTTRGIALHPHPAGGAMILENGLRVYWITTTSAPKHLLVPPERGSDLLTASKPIGGTNVISSLQQEFQPLPDWNADKASPAKSKEDVEVESTKIDGAELRNCKKWRYMAPPADDTKWFYLWDRQGRVVKVDAQTWQPDVELQLDDLKSSTLQDGLRIPAAMILRFSYEQNSKKPNLLFLDPETLAIKSAMRLRFFGPLVPGVNGDQLWIFDPSNTRMMSVLNVGDMSIEMHIDHTDFTNYIKTTIPGLEQLHADWRGEQIIPAGPGRVLWAKDRGLVDNLYHFQIHDGGLSYVNTVPYNAAAYLATCAGNPPRLTFPREIERKPEIAVFDLTAPRKEIFAVPTARPSAAWMDGAGRLYIKTLQELSIRDKEGNVLNTIDISQANLTTENIVHAFGNERRFILQGNNGLTDVRW